jgi:hypothetical protein
MAWEQVAVKLEQARNARRESEESRKANIHYLAKLARAIGVVMTGLGVPFGLMLPDRLLEEVGHLPEVIKERELSTARKAVYRVLAMFESHYQELDRMALSGGWVPGISNAQCDELEEDYAALKDVDLLPEDAPEDLESSRSSS